MWVQSASAYKLGEEFAIQKRGQKNASFPSVDSSSGSSASGRGQRKSCQKNAATPKAVLTDEDSVASSVTETYLGDTIMSWPERNAEDLLKSIKKVIFDQEKREKELDKSIENQLNLAKARYSMSNEKGALLAMKKVKRCQNEREKVVHAIDVLGSHASDIESTLHRSRTFAALDIDGGQSKVIKVDVSQHKNCIADVQKIFSVANSTGTDDESLLEELKKQMHD